MRELLKAFADLAGVVLTIDAMHTQHDTAQLIPGRGADYVMTVKASARCSAAPDSRSSASASYFTLRNHHHKIHARAISSERQHLLGPWRCGR